ncbi:MAG: two-component system response regulator [Desulfuromonas sp.]|uniref:response regulator n=1 Tax=Desulfuromonas sp. TaxID=892 RepID=UPI000CB198A4|nr:response regulator [Desulfuromonas sp.]PLX82305.1 MAG: two-component system response regulator [Desulfuromonas sp.]
MKKILIVDDQPEVKRLLEIILKGGGRQFFHADSGEEAVAIARSEKPDVILLDVMMPGGMDGYENTKALKEDPLTAACPIITMTAKVQAQDQEDAFAAGADDYIGKPFDISDLKEKVDKFLTQ